MNVRLVEPGVLLAFLPGEPQAQPELRLLWTRLAEAEPVHLIIDLSRVEIITSPSIGSLLLLRRLQAERGGRFLLCKVSLATRCILRVVGLDAVFDYADDQPDALKALHQGPGQPVEVSGMGSQSCQVAPEAPLPDVSGLRDSRESSNASM